MKMTIRGPYLSTNQPSIGDQPGFEQHEQREGDLDRRAVPSECLLDVGNEKRPAVLQVGDHHHADNADDELNQGDAKNDLLSYADSIELSS